MLKISIVYPVLFVTRFPVDDVAGACAISKIGNSIFDISILLLFMRPRLVVAGMASGTKARVNRVVVALNDLTIVLVTRNTPYVQIVIARIFRSRMTEVVGRCPALRRMTSVALRRGYYKMPLRTHWWQAGCVSTVVTVSASTGATAVVSPGAAHEGCSSMTG